jgi:cytochrome oxidase Cu insertion factor (SCO1/SenC/PrrC family)
MPGTNSGLDAGDPTMAAAFRSALLHQGVIALLIFAVLSVAWVSLREQSPGGTPGAGRRDPAGRQLLRIGFGLLWLFDAALQVQPGMAAGAPSQVIGAAAASSPGWVQHLAGWAGSTWSFQPVQLGTATLWIEAGIGLWLLAAPRGVSSRLAGLASLTWGLAVWVFGESFGGIFAPGLTWLAGAPGAALLYAAAGALLVLPDRSWQAPRLGRLWLAVLGAFLAGMALLQAWPGRGFWPGAAGSPGTLAGLVQAAAEKSQPHALSDPVSWFASFAAAHGLLVNLVAVIALAATGLAFATGRPRVIRPALAAFAVLCLLAWVLVEDLGFLGGAGTDPGSMIPMVLLAAAGYLALTRPPAPVPAAGPAGGPDPVAGAGWRARIQPAALRRSVKAASFGAMASLGAAAVIVLGVVPLADAETAPAASVLLAQSLDGGANLVDSQAPGFTLTDQRGTQVSLAGLRGKVVLLTFLDPVCVSDCPLIAQEFRQAGQLLGADSRRVELVAVDVNPLYYQAAYTQAFDRQEGLQDVPDWVFLTSSPARLRQVYHAWGVASQTLPAGAMLGHSDIAFAIDPRGHLRQILNMDPGPGVPATQSSFAAELAGAARQLLGPA